MKKRFTIIAAALVAVLSLTSIASAATYMSIATGGTAGTYYAVGGALAAAVSKDGKLRCTAETGNASVANINLVSQKEIEIAFVQNDITYWAVNGELMFKDRPLKNIRVVTALYPEHVQMVVDKNANIKTFMDLKGKRVSIGAPGSGVWGDLQALFAVSGINEKDFKKADYLDFAGTTGRFKDEQIDAGFVVAGYPTASIMDLTASKKNITLCSFSDDFLKKLSATYPFFVPSVIPANVYEGITTDTKTPAVMALLVTHADVPEEDIYNFLSGLFNNLEDVRAAHAKGKEITLKGALDGVTAPLHPGAVKFYKEKGLLK